MADALLHAVGRDRERQPAGQRRAAWLPQLAQPRACERAREHVHDELQQVPPGDEPERRTERPEDEAERPARIVRLWLGLRLERVGVAPRRTAVLQLVTDEPVVVQRLQVVSRRRFAVRGRAPGHELRARVEDGRPRRGNAGREVERGRERYKACAARSSSSKSGSSAVS